MIQPKPSNFYNVDINLTRRCNYNCKYCFAKSEDETDLNLATFRAIKNFLNYLPESSFFKEYHYEMLNIGFWGGEPTLKPSLIDRFIKECDYPTTKFFIFSNGAHLPDRVKYQLERLKYDTVIESRGHGFGRIHPKLCIQISYDGQPVHDMYRVSKTKLLSSFHVRQTIRWLDKNEIPYVLKSTITPESFKYMYDAYMDIKDLSKDLTGKGYKNLDYFPTIDYYTKQTYTTEEMATLCDDLKKSLIKIARKDLKAQVSAFKWFKQNRSLCTAGRDLIAIDVDGSIYNCHGCLYGENKDHKIGHIKNINIHTYETLYENYKKFDEGIRDGKECKGCPVTYCLRCNHAKYNNSKKTEYLDRWRDFKNQPHLCEFYKINHKVKLAYDLLRRENGLHWSY